MHEISLCENIRELLEDQAREEGFDRVTKVWLEVGPLSCVEPEALRFGFEAVMRGSVAEGAALEIATPMAEGKCPSCQRVSQITQRYEICPHCGAPGVQVIRGDELRVKGLEVV